MEEQLERQTSERNIDISSESEDQFDLIRAETGEAASA